MIHIFLSGHGGWSPSLGYTKVPANCTVTFYTHFAKLLMTGMERQILRGDYTEVDRTHTEFKMVPNMKLYGQPESWTKSAEENLSEAAWGNSSKVVSLDDEDDVTTLSELFEELNEGPKLPEEVNFHWLCCSHVGLKAAGGADIGFNASDFNHNKNYQGISGRYRNQNKRGVYKAIRGDLKRASLS